MKGSIKLFIATSIMTMAALYHYEFKVFLVLAITYNLIGFAFAISEGHDTEFEKATNPAAYWIARTNIGYPLVWLIRQIARTADKHLSD